MSLVDPTGKGGFWSDQCPARQAGLAHAHDRDCTDGHAADQCCECGRRAGQDQAVVVAPAPTVQPAQDHEYQFTIVGRCSRCQRPEVDHVKFNRLPDERGCSVDHASINTKLLIGDGGLVWTVCPLCNTPVEPKMIDGAGPKGPAFGPGRGTITDRLARKLGFIKWLSWSRP